MSVEDIINDQIDFCALVTDVSLGVKENLYIKFSHSDNIGTTEIVYFCSPNCLMKSIECKEWFVWKIGGERKLLNYKNDLVRVANIGLGMPPKNFISRMLNGVYPFVFPKFPGEY